ncbi:MlaD family protein [Mycobacteroides chelonae]|uniref:MlaD family protein n=2 Tax=Mycobacteroides chelonae TaxID=1774 RepID=UPI001D0C2069|nr:MlaD family protein [Mycobacteroides chelonae]
MTATLVAGCASGLQSLPLPAPGGSSGGYAITAEFSNALNLPAKAKVKLNGADIGEVDSIRAQNFTAYVHMRINTDVQLPVGSTAELRSATPLGDVFVAIRPSLQARGSAPLLHQGDTIPVGSTTAAATVEQVLTSAALLVNGGTVRHLTSIVNGAGSAVGGRGVKVGELIQQTSRLISRLSARSNQVSTALRTTSDLASTLSGRQDTINAALAAAGPATSVIADNAAVLADLVDGVARITGQLSRFPSLQGTDQRSLIADLNQLSAAFNEVSVDPNLSLAALNRLIPIVMKISNSTSMHGGGEAVKLALGSLPDKNYPGDPGFHGPDGTDWHAMIGSLRYEWNLLLGKSFGPERDGVTKAEPQR